MQSGNYARRRLENIDCRLEELEHLLKTLPEGRLHVSATPRRIQYYQVIGKRGDKDYSKKYLTRANHYIASELARKEQLEIEYEELLIEKSSIEALLSLQEKTPAIISKKRLRQNSKYFQELLRENALRNDAFAWSLAPYSSSAPNPEGRRVKSINGLLVRSKSEAEIVMLLSRYNIPFRYECDLVVNNRIIGCPDFTIMHPKTHEILIWEHFGLLDNPSYVRRNIYKVQAYIESGYYPMINFILTSETADNPFDVTLADELIKHYFL